MGDSKASGQILGTRYAVPQTQPGQNIQLTKDGTVISHPGGFAAIEAAKLRSQQISLPGFEHVPLRIRVRDDAEPAALAQATHGQLRTYLARLRKQQTTSRRIAEASTEAFCLLANFSWRYGARTTGSAVGMVQNIALKLQAHLKGPTLEPSHVSVGKIGAPPIDSFAATGENEGAGLAKPANQFAARRGASRNAPLARFSLSGRRS